MTDYFSKYEHGWHISPTCAGADAIEAVKLAIAEAGRLGGAPLPQLLPAHPDGTPVRIKLVTDNGPAFKGAASRSSSPPGPSWSTSAPAPKAQARTGCASVRSGCSSTSTCTGTPSRSPPWPTCNREAEAYRKIFNEIRPHEALGMRLPIQIIRDPRPHPIHKNQTEESVPEA